MKWLRYRLHRTWIFLRYRKNHIIFLIILASLATWVLWLGTDGFKNNKEAFFLNISTDILSLIFAYLLFDSILHRIEQDRIKEHPELDIPRFIRRIDDAEHKVRILSTWSDFISIPANKEKFLPVVRQATLRGVYFEILLLDPRSTAVLERQRDIGSEYNVEQSIRDNLREVHKLLQSPINIDPSKIQVRLYDRSPTMSFNMADDRAFVSFYPLNKSSSQNNQLEVSMKTQLGNFLNDTFNEIWKSAEERDLDKYLFLSLINTEKDDKSSPYRCKFVRINEFFYIISGIVATDLIGRTVYPEFKIYLNKTFIPCEIKLIKPTENRTTFNEVAQSFIKKYDNFDDNVIIQITPKI